jgi:hypothetical protein
VRDDRNPALPIVGRVKRFGGLPGAVTVDPFFEKFLAQSGFDVAPEFVRVVPDSSAEWVAVNKYSQEPYQHSTVTDACIDLATEWVIHDMAPHVESDLASWDEIVGYLDLSKNPGGLWMNDYGTKFETIESPEFWPWFEDHYWPSQFTEMPIYTLTAWFMKSEMRSRKKALENALRSISGKSLEHILAMNKFDLRFNLSFVKFGGVSWSALGVPLVRGGWESVILRRLGCFPNNYMLDVSLNDSTMFRKFMESVQRVRVALKSRALDAAILKSPGLLQAWNNLFLQKFEGFQILSDGTVIWKWEGQDSGQCSTIVDNTLCSKIRLVACFIELYLWEFQEFPSKSFFDAHVADLHLGDDCNWSNSDVVNSWFNMDAVSLWYRNAIGVHVTTPSFDPVLLTEVEFLSQTTSFERGYPIPALNGTKMVCSLRWGNQKPGVLSYSLQRCLAFRFATWATPREFRLVDDYARWLVRCYAHVMTGDSEWDAAMFSYFTDSELARLWFPVS